MGSFRIEHFFKMVFLEIWIIIYQWNSTFRIQHHGTLVVYTYQRLEFIGWIVSMLFTYAFLLYISDLIREFIVQFFYKLQKFLWLLAVTFFNAYHKLLNLFLLLLIPFFSLILKLRERLFFTKRPQLRCILENLRFERPLLNIFIETRDYFFKLRDFLTHLLTVVGVEFGGGHDLVVQIFEVVVDGESFGLFPKFDDLALVRETLYFFRDISYFDRLLFH